ncbi:MAG TPA: AMP-binding protein [Caulobacterales bacterium]|nr:AMP-binding protein [Caulobacterales bacterium]
MSIEATAAYRQAPWREAKLMPVDLDVARRDDGTILLASRVPLKAYDHNIPAVFSRRAKIAGEKAALARRDATGSWAFSSFSLLKRDMDAAAQWLLNVQKPGPVLILAPNSPAFAVMTFAAYASGRAACPVSTTYAVLGGSYGRLAHVIAKVKPAVVFAEDSGAVGDALAALDLGGATIVTADPARIAKPSVAFADVIKTTPTAAVDASIERIRRDDIASLMLTSGSTGLPKVVPITFDNLAANSAQCQQIIGEAAGWREVMLDWLPWHHAAGAFVYRTTLLEGGTLYIDDGKPAPGLFDTTLRNLREISVSYFNNVPLGYGMLVDALEKDETLRRTFFKKLRLMLYGGAGLPQGVYDRLQALAVAETGRRIMMTSAYGMTEAVSGFMAIHFETDKVGIGLPSPGVRLKLVPSGDRYELRVKGPNVTKGYLDEPEKTAAAFDEEGYYRTGDLCVFHDPADPAKGLAFAGRAAEEFKLSSGAWVYGGALRDALMKALGSQIVDLVLCDDDRPYLALMLWPKAGASADEIARRLAEFNESQHGGASRIRRALLLSEPPSANAHEMSDKGTINRRGVIERRAADVARLYADAPDEAIMRFN